MAKPPTNTNSAALMRIISWKGFRDSHGRHDFVHLACSILLVAAAGQVLLVAAAGGGGAHGKRTPGKQEQREAHGQQFFVAQCGSLTRSAS